MENEELQNSQSIKEGELLSIANNILSLLDSSQQLDDEEVLFSDEFYISIISSLLTEQNSSEIKPGETPEEKVESLKKLIKLISEIIEMDLSQINAVGIIMNHDKISAKSFLDLIEELIKTLMNANLEEENSNNNEEKNNEKEKNELKAENENINNSDKNNKEYNSENLIKNIRNRMALDDTEENEDSKNSENSSYKRKYAELENGIDDIDENDIYDDEEEGLKSEEKKNEIMDINYNKEEKSDLSDSRIMNISHISEMNDKDKNIIKEKSSSKKNKGDINKEIELEENMEYSSSKKK